jgi:3-phosphoshikimate 1-carboxyvinyltransferase
VQHRPPPRPLATERSPALRGIFSIPGDSILAHLGIFCGLVSRGETVIANLPDTPDVASSREVVAELGAVIGFDNGVWRISGLCSNGLLEPQGTLAPGHSLPSGTLALGLLAPYDFESRITLDGAAAVANVAPLLQALSQFGTTFAEGRDGHFPITLRGPRLPLPLRAVFDMPNLLFKQAAMLGALSVPGISTITERVSTPDHVERLLSGFGAHVEKKQLPTGVMVSVTGLPELRGRQLTLPGDPQAAAFGMVAATVVPGSEIVIQRVLMHPLRNVLYQTLLEMGADIAVTATYRWGAEEVADLRIRASGLRGVVVPADRLRLLGSDLPALVVAAAVADGETRLEGIAALRGIGALQVEAMAAGLAASGTPVELGPDHLRIGGGAVSGGQRVLIHGQASLAMAFLILGLVAGQPVVIDDESPIDAVFPGFVPALQGIGAPFLRYAE